MLLMIFQGVRELNLKDLVPQRIRASRQFYTYVEQKSDKLGAIVFSKSGIGLPNGYGCLLTARVG